MSCSVQPAGMLADGRGDGAAEAEGATERRDGRAGAGGGSPTGPRTRGVLAAPGVAGAPKLHAGAVAAWQAATAHGHAGQARGAGDTEEAAAAERRSSGAVAARARPGTRSGWVVNGGLHGQGHSGAGW